MKSRICKIEISKLISTIFSCFKWTPLVIIVMIVALRFSNYGLNPIEQIDSVGSKMLHENPYSINTSKQTIALLDQFEVWLDQWGPIMINLLRKQKQEGIILEGNIWNYNIGFTRMPQLRAYFKHIMERKRSISRICEIGFNGGHSALMWSILFDGKIDIVSFDFCKDLRCKIGETEIKKWFPNVRLQIVKGDSTKTVRSYHVQFKDVKCNFISIDGGHTGNVPETDILNMQYLAAENHTIVMDDVGLDDTLPESHYLKVVGTAWRNALKKNKMRQLGECGRCNPLNQNNRCMFCF